MKDRIASYLRAGYSGLYLVSHEEQRVEAEVLAAAKKVNFTVWAWSLCSGLLDVANGKVVAEKEEPIAMLEHVGTMPEKSVVLLRDFHTLLDDRNPVLSRKLREALQAGKTRNVALVIVGCRIVLPPELEKEITVLEFKLPDRAQLGEVLDALCTASTLPVLAGAPRDEVLDAARGLTTVEAEAAFALSQIEMGSIHPDVISREKAATVKKNGLLEIVETNMSLDDIGGLDEIKSWLLKRRRAFGPEAVKYKLPTPKGFLALGPPGSGKSLLAKATAKSLNVPLLKLDAGKLFGSLVGQSEGNLRAALATAEAVSPCVLWIDELEKAFSGTKSSGSTDGGTTARVFGTFLQWMQEKKTAVFVVATANDVSALPPELLRKGRFDENWFVDLPNEKERLEIWNLKVKQFGRDPAKFDLTALAKATAEFTGAEIESLFSDAMFSAFDENKEPDSLLLMQLANQAVPLSRMMATEIKGLRDWSEGKARRATPVEEKKKGRSIIQHQNN